MTATGHWRIGIALAALAVGIGVVANNTAIFLSSVIGLTYATYGYATQPPELRLDVDRFVEPDAPSPGDEIDVTVHVENEGDVPVTDLRLADEPPATLEMIDGNPRAGVTLQPGEVATLEYTLRASRGEHTFGAVTALAHNVSASEATRERFDLETTLECDDALERLPLTGQTIQHTGRVETDVGGEGLEFYSIRNFQPSDPMNRVDWKRLARTGELTTIEFREERAASVVVVVDVRRENEVVRASMELSGLELSTHAAEWIATALLSENNRVGVALYGGQGQYLLPRSGRDQVARVQRLLTGDWCGSFGRPNWLSAANAHVGRFCRHLADEKQILFVTPLVEDMPVESARRFRAYGHDVTVVCPMIADTGTPGAPIEQIALDSRLRELRGHGIRVLEWQPDDPLHVAVERARKRWSR